MSCDAQLLAERKARRDINAQRFYAVREEPKESLAALQARVREECALAAQMSTDPVESPAEAP